MTTSTTISHLVNLIYEVRPDWEPGLVRLVLNAHVDQVTLCDLSIASLRAASNLDARSPKVIGWRGPHWQGLRTKPIEVRDPAICGVCGKPEPRCWGERPGPDDHVFERKREAS